VASTAGSQNPNTAPGAPAAVAAHAETQLGLEGAEQELLFAGLSLALVRSLCSEELGSKAVATCSRKIEVTQGCNCLSAKVPSTTGRVHDHWFPACFYAPCNAKLASLHSALYSSTQHRTCGLTIYKPVHPGVVLIVSHLKPQTAQAVGCTDGCNLELFA